jgi:hypothetical protein
LRLLTVEMMDGAIWIWDAKGDAAKITIKNVMQSNGVIHVIRANPPPRKLCTSQARRARRGGPLPSFLGSAARGRVQHFDFCCSASERT